MCVLAPPPAHRVEQQQQSLWQKATFSQNQPNDLKLMALTVVPTNTPAMLEHGFKLCIFVGVACRYLLQDHRDPPQRNELSPKSSQSETVLRRKMFNWASRNSQTSLSAFIDHMYTLLIMTTSFIHVTCRWGVFSSVINVLHGELCSCTDDYHVSVSRLSQLSVIPLLHLCEFTETRFWGHNCDLGR